MSCPLFQQGLIIELLQALKLRAGRFLWTYYEDGVWSDWVKIEGLDDKNTQYKDPQLVKDGRGTLILCIKNNGNKGV